jgi:hypothetical protein
MHEQSETIQREDGKWINVYGRHTKQAGQQLPNSEIYDSLEDAEKAAKSRSKMADIKIDFEPITSNDPNEVGSFVGDKRRLDNDGIRSILESQLSDPYRNKAFDEDLQKELSRVGGKTTPVKADTPKIDFEPIDFQPIKEEQFGDRSWYRRGAEGAIGALETAVRMPWNFVVGEGAAGIRYLGERAFGADHERAAASAESSREAATIHPFTKAGEYLEQEFVGPLFQKAKEIVASGVEGIEMVRQQMSLLPDTEEGRLKKQILAYALGEYGFDAVLGVSAGRGALQGARGSRQARIDAENAAKEFEAGKAKLKEQQDLQTFQEGLYETDANMVRYPQDYQAPQFGQFGQGELPPGGSRGLPPDSQKPRVRIPTQERYDADITAIAEAQRLERDTPIPYERPEMGLELTGERGQPTMTFDVYKGPDIPTYSLQAPLEAFPAERPSTPMMESVSIDPINPKQIYTSMAESMDRVSGAALIDRLEGNRVIQRLTEDVTKQKEYLRGLEEQLATEKLTQAQNRRSAEGTGEVPKGYKGYTERIERLEKQIETAKSVLQQMNEKGAKTVENITKAAQRTAPKIEKTKDGRQMLKLPKRMRGAIDTDLLTFGIPKLIERLGNRKAIEKFKGTYNPRELDTLIKNHIDPKHESAIVWMAPDDFHKMAFPREYGYTPSGRVRSALERSAEGRRETIREGLKGPAGLHDIPRLTIEVSYENGKWIAETTGHEGRHRMDVMKELNLEQVPIEVKILERDIYQDSTIHQRIKSGKVKIDEWRGEGSSYLDRPVIPFPEIPNLKFPSLDYAIAKKQAGAANVDLLTDIATLGVSKLVRNALKKGEPSPKTPLPTSEKKGTNNHDILELASGETRSPKEMEKSLTPEQRKQDISETLWGANPAQQVNASFMNQFRNHPMVKYVGARVNQAIRSGHLLANVIKEGSTFSFSYGRIHRHIDPNSPKAVWSALTNKERLLLSNIANEYGAKYKLSPTELKTLGANDKVVKAYDVFTKAYERAIDEVNSLRPNDPINKLPGYFPRFRQGDFKVSVIDKVTGDPIFVDLFWTRGFGGLFGRSKMVKFLEEKFPEHKIEVSTVDRGNRGNPYNVSTVPFEELIKAIGRNDPRARIIESAIREFGGKRGFGRHAIQRKNIGGGDLTPQNFYKAFETYVDSATRYKSNLEMTKLDMEIKSLTELEAPRFKQWASTYIDLAKGSFQPGKFVDGVYKALEVFTTAISGGQLGPNAPAHAIRAMNNYFMAKALFFYRPAFLVAQTIQPFQFTPQWLAHYQLQGYKGNVGSAMAMGEFEIMKSIAGKDGKEFKKFIEEYMAPRGNIDPTMIHSMDLFGTGVGKGYEMGRWVVGTAPAQAIEAFGRLQTSAMAFKFFSDAGLKGKDLYMKTEEAVNNIMSDYSRHEQPAWITKSGVIGQMVGPLSTFATNFWASTALFLKDVATNPTNLQAWKPIGIHLAQTALWSGLTGMLGMQVVDTLIDIIKEAGVVNAKFPTMTEYVMTNDKIPDLVSHGAVSGLTGLNLGASMAAPDMRVPSAQSIPGIKLATDFIMGMKPILTGHATRNDWIAASKIALPNYIGSFLDVYDIDPATMDFRRRESGEIVPNPLKRGFGNVRSDEFDQFARMLGTRSVKESRELEGVRMSQAQTQLINEKKTKLIDLGADSIMYGTGPEMDELIEKAWELDMNIKEYMNAVFAAMKQREMTAEERTTGLVPKTQNQFRKYEMIDAFKNESRGGMDFRQGTGGTAVPSQGLPTVPTAIQAAIPNLQVQQSNDTKLRAQGLNPSLIGGYVDPDHPKTMFLNTKGPFDLDTTVAHEGDHLIAKEMNKGEAAAVNVRYDELREKNKDRADIPNRNELVQRIVDIAPHLIEKYGLDKQDAYFDKRMLDFQKKYGLDKNLLYEQLASLSALQQVKDIRLVDDPKFMKEVLKNKTTAAIFESLMGTRQTMLDAKDLRPYTPYGMDEKKGFYQKINDYLSGKSLRNK